jgi:hypothetical protein
LKLPQRRGRRACRSTMPRSRPGTPRTDVRVSGRSTHAAGTAASVDDTRRRWREALAAPASSPPTTATDLSFPAHHCYTTGRRSRDLARSGRRRWPFPAWFLTLVARGGHKNRRPKTETEKTETETEKTETEKTETEKTVRNLGSKLEKTEI